MKNFKIWRGIFVRQSTFRSILLLLMATVPFSSCKKFLDINRNSSQTLIETADHCQLILDNYVIMNTGYPYGGELSSDDYYVDDVTYRKLNNAPEDQRLYLWDAKGIQTSEQWTSLYNKVYNANLVLEAVEKIAKKGDTDVGILNNLRGSALFFRAYAFWNVAQLYAQPYSTATLTSPGIALRLNSDMNEKTDRGTLQQTYEKIVSDLKEASGLLKTSSEKASRPNKAAAYAMLARVYLSMENYVDAGTNANAALEFNAQLMNYNDVNKSEETPFARFNPEVIFQSVIMKPGDSFLNPGYRYRSWAIIMPELINLYAVNDLRKQIFFKENISDEDYSTPNGTFRFSGNYNQEGYQSSFFTGLALDEMYLIRAEAYARSGNLALAMKDLNDLLRTRWVADTYIDQSANSETEALQLILTERRKELLMRGLRWTDLRRLNTDSRFNKTLTRTINGQTYSLPPGDLRYVLLIPRDVIDFSKIVQNPR